MKRLRFSKAQVSSLVQILLKEGIYVPLTKESILKSFQLIDKYDFQIFDSIIVAAALEAKCDILYSEDMQHQQIIEKQLTIINPFIL